MAKASGLSVSTVQSIWRAFGLQPHRLETFKLSTDPDFVAEVAYGIVKITLEMALGLPREPDNGPAGTHFLRR